ncbi:hypothetical protein FS749_007622 [Ceratobasidium sp. UAMH 11750]|nr:hypothetical protein FS749_007622 [Ceratobasidium sp. UAMH 11750]
MTGIAKKYNIREVTPAFLVYVAVVVRHALTSDKEYNDTSSGFNYPAFYDSLLNFLKNPKYKAVTKPLIKWWNLELFGPYGLGNSVNAPVPSNKGMLAMLDAALLEGPLAADPHLADY